VKSWSRPMRSELQAALCACAVFRARSRQQAAAMKEAAGVLSKEERLTCRSSGKMNLRVGSDSVLPGYLFASPFE
jgi:hypothetical protein